MLTRTVTLMLVSGLALAGCAEQDVLRYQGREAQSAAECRAAFEAAKQRGSSASAGYSSGASALGASFGKGLARGIIESSYRQCLARVANMPASADGETRMVAPTQTTYVAPKGAGRGHGAENARARFDAEMRNRRIAPGSATCYEGAPLLYRGTLYCPKR